MDVNEARKKKWELSNLITEKIRQFEKETGLKVESITSMNISENRNLVAYVLEVKI